MSTDEREVELHALGSVREHYASEGVAARVLTALRNVNGPEVPITPEPSRRLTTSTERA